MIGKTLEMNGLRLTKVTRIWDDEQEGCTIENVLPGIEWKGPEPTNATITIEQALVIAEANKGQYDRPFHVAPRAAGLMVLDHNIRTEGQAITSQYDGTDAITGEKFQAGTEIIWSRQHGTIIA